MTLPPYKCLHVKQQNCFSKSRIIFTKKYIYCYPMPVLYKWDALYHCLSLQINSGTNTQLNTVQFMINNTMKNVIGKCSF